MRTCSRFLPSYSSFFSIRSVATSVAGSTAGILGLVNLSGFYFYLLSVLLTNIVIFLFTVHLQPQRFLLSFNPAPDKPEQVSNSDKNLFSTVWLYTSFFLEGAQDMSFGYVLWWTLWTALIHGEIYIALYLASLTLSQYLISETLYHCYAFCYHLDGFRPVGWRASCFRSLSAPTTSLGNGSERDLFRAWISFLQSSTSHAISALDLIDNRSCVLYFSRRNAEQHTVPNTTCLSSDASIKYSFKSVQVAI